MRLLCVRTIESHRRRNSRAEESEDEVKPNSIEWHRMCLGNWIANIARNRALAESAMSSVERQEDELETYEQQIEEAESRGLAEFDRDKFMKSRKARTK